MEDSEKKKSSENENKKEKKTAKPKKVKEMEIITTVRKIREAVKCNSVLKSYLIFQDILNYEEQALKDHEHLWVMGIDTAGYVVCVYIVAIGRGNRVILDPIDILDIAITKKARRIILAHNHPGQEMATVFPSKKDIEFTNRIYHASKPFAFEILDHLILCDDGYFSFLSENLMDTIDRMKDYKPYNEIKPELDAEKEEAVKTGKKIGFDKGKLEEKIKIVKEMLKIDSNNLKMIHQVTKLSIEEIMKIKKDMKK